MTYLSKSLAVVTLVLLSACQTTTKKEKDTDSEVSQPISKAEITVAKEQLLLNDAIAAHGGHLYEQAHYTFQFRKKQYTFKNDKGRYLYSVKSSKDENEIYDVLENGRLTRTINSAEVSLSNKDIAKYSEALNSVVYFATLPHKLKDKAVTKTYEGTTYIKGVPYDVLGVTFKQEGGGTDFDDTFHYWIHQEKKTVDYLAYSYSTNEGGVRFRSAYNPRTIDGIRFQDYINYEAPIGTALGDLPPLYEKGDLKELSRILTEDVRSLR